MPGHASPLVQRHLTLYRAPYLVYPLVRWGPT
ncbi:hypothetical protein FBZ33_4069 [Micromonospora sp. A202]|nr:hypothetical protein FBZ33_4069 [Micromonospora sp. A202]